MSTNAQFKTNILVVDDEEDIRSTLTDFLKEEGFVVFEAQNGSQALEIIEKENIDLIMSDLRMPGMDGIQLTQKIQELRLDIPVILMTAYASIEYAVESMKAGAIDFIPKPFKFNHTLFIIQKAIETRRLQEAARKTDFYKKLSNIDGLTNIYNHRFFKKMIHNEIQRHSRYSRFMSLLMVDIDDFKKVNDTYGHPVGDLVLKQTAALMQKSIRGCDILARYGGEEFAVILPETPENEAFMVGERIVQTIRNHPFRTPNGQPIEGISVTVGLASFPKDAVAASPLIEKADKALYNGKSAGKNRIAVYTRPLL